jgi:uncharacterized membrane protein YeiH
MVVVLYGWDGIALSTTHWTTRASAEGGVRRDVTVLRELGVVVHAMAYTTSHMVGAIVIVLGGCMYSLPHNPEIASSYFYCIVLYVRMYRILYVLLNKRHL